MTDDDLVDDFVELFRGRGDCYGSAKGFCVHKPLTRAVFEQHLRSTDPEDHIGVYCMLGEHCSWGCIDIDGKDFPIVNTMRVSVSGEAGMERVVPTTIEHDWEKMARLAINLQTVLAAKFIHAHIERTRNGYHLWVFPPSLVAAKTMRRALMAACKAVGYDPKEVNPKAEGPRAGTKGLGNFVRLPYSGALSGQWDFGARFMVEPEIVTRTAFIPLRLDAWLASRPQRTAATHLEAVAALWTPPPVPRHEVDFEAGLDAEPIIRRLDGKTYTIWKDGPLPGSDRSTTLARLAHLLAEDGFTATQAFAVIRSADERWGGKFANRADGPEQLGRIIENAYC